MTVVPVLWHVMSCSLVKEYWHCKGFCCLHHLGSWFTLMTDSLKLWHNSTRLHGITCHKAAVIFVTTTRI